MDAPIALAHSDPAIRDFWIEVDSKLAVLCPVNPSLEVFGFNLVPIDFLPSELSVGCMEVQSMLARDECECLIQIRTKFVGCSRLAGIIPGHRESSAEITLRILEPADVITLPAVE